MDTARDRIGLEIRDPAPALGSRLSSAGHDAVQWFWTLEPVYGGAVDLIETIIAGLYLLAMATFTVLIVLEAREIKRIKDRIQR